MTARWERISAGLLWLRAHSRLARHVRDAGEGRPERGRLRELIREEICTARLQVRCEHDRSVVAVVQDDCI